MESPAFIPGLELNRRFYWEVVRPLLDARFPGLPHSAAQIGTGSDILGFDTPMSMDHDWGPGVLLFLSEEDWHLAESVRELMRHHLPHQFLGFPTNYGPASGDEVGTTIMLATTRGPVNHHVWPVLVRSFFQRHLHWDVEQELTAADWLTLSSQTLRGITSGAVYHDGVGELTRIRSHLAWYPHDVWLYLLAAGWLRLSNEEHLMPRAGYLGDELGSAIIGARLVRDVMNLCFLMERQYAPYAKWLGTAFQQLECASQLVPLLEQVLRAPAWQQREEALSRCYSHLARMHNALGITTPLLEAVSSFHDRPFQVIHGERFSAAIVAEIHDGEVAELAKRPLIGGIDQVSDNTALVSHISWRAQVLALYRDFASSGA
jgi:hypothetical protein